MTNQTYEKICKFFGYDLDWGEAVRFYDMNKDIVEEL